MWNYVDKHQFRHVNSCTQTVSQQRALHIIVTLSPTSSSSAVISASYSHLLSTWILLRILFELLRLLLFSSGWITGARFTIPSSSSWTTLSGCASDSSSCKYGDTATGPSSAVIVGWFEPDDALGSGKGKFTKIILIHFSLCSRLKLKA